MLSLYVPGSSPVHRAPAGVKLAVLAALGIALFATTNLALVAAALVGRPGSGDEAPPGLKRFSPRTR